MADKTPGAYNIFDLRALQIFREQIDCVMVLRDRICG